MFGFNWLAEKGKPQIGQIIDVMNGLKLQVLNVNDAVYTHVDGPLYYRLSVKKVNNNEILTR